MPNEVNLKIRMTLEWRDTQNEVDWDELTELFKHHKKIILYAVPGKEPFYRKLGFKRRNTAMAIFADPAQALWRGLVSED